MEIPLKLALVIMELKLKLILLQSYQKKLSKKLLIKYAKLKFFLTRIIFIKLRKN